MGLLVGSSPAVEANVEDAPRRAIPELAGSFRQLCDHADELENELFGSGVGREVA